MMGFMDCRHRNPLRTRDIGQSFDHQVKCRIGKAELRIDPQHGGKRLIGNRFGKPVHLARTGLRGIGRNAAQTVPSLPCGLGRDQGGCHRSGIVGINLATQQGITHKRMCV